MHPPRVPYLYLLQEDGHGRRMEENEGKCCLCYVHVLMLKLILCSDASFLSLRHTTGSIIFLLHVGCAGIDSSGGYVLVNHRISDLILVL